MTSAVSIYKIIFVLNPISGDINKDEVQELITNFCAEFGFVPELHFTTGRDDKRILVELITEKKPDAVVAVGGDGTVSLVAQVLNHGEIPLGIIPLGSGNGLSKDLGIPQDTASALEVLQNFKIRKIDSLEINGRMVFHLSDLGFNARIVKKFDEGETRGPGAYAWIALQEYLNYEPLTYKITTDSDSFEGPLFMVTIANANAFGSNAAINPSGVIDDGIFELCLIEPFPKTAALGILYNLYTASIHDSVYSKIFKCKSAEIIREDIDVLQIDGEPIETGTELKIKIHNCSLPVLVPPDIVRT